jgi:toxin ParE1/3/4
MERYPVVYLQTALDDIGSIFLYVMGESASFAVAERYTERIYARCEKIGDAPHSGVQRSDIREGFRMTVFERRLIIIYQVVDGEVRITNILSGTRDYAALMHPPK